MKEEALNIRYQEICRLEEMLLQAGADHSICRISDGCIIRYPKEGARICCAVEFTGTVGAELDRIEIMGLLTGEERKTGIVAGNLTAEDVFGRIRADMERRT